MKMIPSWILAKGSKPSSVFISPDKRQIRLHQFNKSPQLRYSQINPFGNQPGAYLKKIRNYFSSDIRRFGKQPIKLLFDPKKNKKILLKSSKVNLKKSGKINFYKPRVKNLPPISNQLARSVANNSLISSIGIKYNSSDDDSAEWNMSESEEDAKNLQDYLKQYLHLH